MFHCNNKVVKYVPHLCPQKTDACHTINHPSHPPVATAHLAPAPPRARRDHAKQMDRGSRSSGPSPSTQISWGPLGRGSTQESYVSLAALSDTAAMIVAVRTASLQLWCWHVAESFRIYHQKSLLTTMRQFVVHIKTHSFNLSLRTAGIVKVALFYKY